jgi:hypothetical protein
MSRKVSFFRETRKKKQKQKRRREIDKKYEIVKDR